MITLSSPTETTMATATAPTLAEILAALPVAMPTGLAPFCAPYLSEEPAEGNEMEFLIDDGDYSDYVTLGELADTLAAYNEAEVTYTLEIYLPAAG
jgi:hypothetical protein